MTSDGGADPILAVRNLRKVYGDGDDEVTAVEDVSLSVERGEVVGLLGPNGAGKTTTIKSALGVVTPTAGSIRVGGVDPHERPREAYRTVSAVLEGARNVYWRLTVRENLRFFTGLQGIHPDSARDEHDRLLAALDLRDRADETARNLSRGMQQKLSLGCALVRDTPLLFLDEPTLGLDVEASRDLRGEITRLAEEEDRAIVLSSHDMDVIREVCDRVVILNEGRVVVDDAVEELVEVFRTRSYRIRFETVGDARGTLTAFEADWDGDAVEVTLPDREALYDLMDRLREAGAVVDAVDTVEPDLEDIFLEVTGRADEWGGSERARDGSVDRDREVRA